MQVKQNYPKVISRKCYGCKEPYPTIRVTQKVPKNMQARFGKTQTYYTSNHNCEKLRQFTERASRPLQILSDIL